MLIRPNSLPSQVIGITDGDTLKVLTEEKKQVKIRLAEIDTPERKQPWGNRAKQAVSELTFQKMVAVHPVTIDRYGRTVAHIFIDGVSVSHEMIRTGNAWVYRKYMKDESLMEIEGEARKSKLGLWGLPEAQNLPPWEWRKQKRK